MTEFDIAKSEAETVDYIQKIIISEEFRLFFMLAVLIILVLISACVISIVRNGSFKKSLASAGKCMGIFFAFNILSVVLSNICAVILNSLNAGLTENISNRICTVAGYAISMIITYKYANSKDIAFCDLIKFYPKKIKFSLVGWCLLFGVGCTLFTSSLFSVFENIWPELFEQYNNLSESHLMTGDVVVNVLYSIIAAPIMEEMLYRGILIKSSEKEFSSYSAIVVPTIIFAWMHLPSIIWFTYAFIYGLVLSIILQRFRNIAYSMAFHIGFNLSALMAFLPKLAAQDGTSAVIYCMVFGALAISFALFNIVRVERYKKIG